MNNEPVGYYYSNACFDIRDCSEQMKRNGIPLYTHPAKTLTDEEIEEVYRTVEQDFALTESKKPNGGWRNFPIELARAILRKAQEK